jgi:hypothetical protein
MTCYSVPSDMVPDDGYPYDADWCPTCQEPRPFRTDDYEMTCAVCGYVQEYEGTNSPGTSPEGDDPEADEPEDEPEDDWDDAMTVSFNANSTDIGVEDEPDTIGYCNSPECKCLRTFAPDMNDENELMVCQMCGCLMDGAADYT